MTIQHILTLAIVVLAGLYLAHRSWMSWSGKGGGCGKGCDCKEPADQSPLISSDELTARFRPGQRNGESL